MLNRCKELVKRGKANKLCQLKGNELISLSIVFLFLVTGAAYAHTFERVEKTCPICAHTFTCVLDKSDILLGMRLDLKPLMRMGAPWRIPVCPKCHFVLYSDNIPAEELAKCKDIVQTDAYKKHTGRASYYLLGLLYEGLGKNSLGIGHIFLKASWQEESDEKKLKEDLERSLGHFNVYLKMDAKEKLKAEKEKEADNAYQTVQMLKGELLRRLGRFDEARAYLTDLQKLKEFQGTFMADVVRYEITLCDRKDSQPHNTSEVEKTTDPEPKDAGEKK